MADVEQLGLAPQDYHRLVAPALEVCAKLAAQRGDPDLYNDMPCMLALVSLVGGLVECYRADGGAAPAATLARTPLAACWMVLHESSLSEAQIDDCLRALEGAHEQLSTAGVIGPERERIASAWRELERGETRRASGLLWLAASQVAQAVDEWEAGRDGA